MNDIDIKFGGPNSEFVIITKENYLKLPVFMLRHGIKKLLIKSSNDMFGWNETFLPPMENFNFIEELFILWSHVSDISDIEYCKNLKNIILDNNDQTEINFSKFPFLEKLMSWDRRGIELAWNIFGLKELSLFGLKKKQFRNGLTLQTLEKLHLKATAVEDLSFLKDCNRLKKLILTYMSKLKDIDFLRTLSKLENLTINANKIESFKIISELKNLEQCTLVSKNAKAEVDDFIHFNNMKKFLITGNNQLQIINKEVNTILKTKSILCY